MYLCVCVCVCAFVCACVCVCVCVYNILDLKAMRREWSRAPHVATAPSHYRMLCLY